RQGDATVLGNDLWSRAYDSVGQLAQPIELGGKRGARRAAAAAGADGARARLADTVRQVDASVVRAYVSAALAQASVAITRDSANDLREEARIATARFKAGDISRTDRDQIEIAAARFELDAAGAEASAKEQRIGLAQLLGIAGPYGIRPLADSLADLANRDSGAVDAQLAAGRADVVAARADLRRAGSELRLERALRIPDPTPLAPLEHAPPDRPNSAGAGVSLPVPLWNRNAGAIAAARAGRDDAERALRRFEAQALSDVETARAARDEAEHRWRRYRDELEPQSEEVR